MPTVAVERDVLFALMGRSYTKEEFEDLCFSFGIELDDVTSERLMFQREHADGLRDPSQSAALSERLQQLSDKQVFKIDTPANRYDLLSAESLTTALKVFAGLMQPPVIRRCAPVHKMIVKSSVNAIRPFVVCAVLRGVSLTPERYRSFNEFQDKLHNGLARKRSLASVGAHDLDKVSPPFSFEAVAKENIQFVPLEQTKEMNCAGNGLAEFYSTNPYIAKYVPLISNSPLYPVVYDSRRTVMSLPPIINSDFSKIEVKTRNIFIECTAIDHHRASTLVTQLVSAFSFYCDSPFTVEQVEVVYEDASLLHSAPSGANVKGNSEITPALESRSFEVDVSNLRSVIGIDVDATACQTLLHKMMMSATATKPDILSVTVPPHRSDILHARDIMEDVAIAYGYDNIKMTPPTTLSHGSQTTTNKVSHLLRLELGCAGCVEMLTFSLCSRDDAFKNLNRVDDGSAVSIANPQTIEFQICRPSLLPGTMKTIVSNKYMPLPLRLFEVSDVVLRDATSRTGARNERHVSVAIVQSATVSFEDVHGVAEIILEKLGFKRLFSSDVSKPSQYYELKVNDSDPAFFPGRCLEVTVTKSNVTTSAGKFGVLHPLALTAHGIVTPCSYLELNLEALI